jgi:hypothetical protein
MLKLIPISETDASKNASNISIKDLEYFGFLATTLRPIDSFSIIDGYIDSLWEYMQEIKYQNKELFNKYDKLIHAQQGNIILKTAIELFLMEKDMRDVGIIETITNKYNNTQKYYLSLIRDLEE